MPPYMRAGVERGQHDDARRSGRMPKVSGSSSATPETRADARAARRSGCPTITPAIAMRRLNGVSAIEKPSARLARKSTGRSEPEHADGERHPQPVGEDQVVDAPAVADARRRASSGQRVAARGSAASTTRKSAVPSDHADHVEQRDEERRWRRARRASRARPSPARQPGGARVARAHGARRAAARPAPPWPAPSQNGRNAGARARSAPQYV